VAFKTLSRVLQYAYPENHWNDSHFSFKGKKSDQRLLYIKLSHLLPECTEIFEDYMHKTVLEKKIAGYL